MHSGLRRRHEGLTDEYRAITDELRAVCRVFGRDVLREVPEADFLTRLPQVRAAAGDRAVNRAFHVYAENRRALAEKEALEQGDFDRFLALVRESGRSSAMYLQNIIPTGSTAAQELMVTIALCEALLADRGAVRVHGGGFGVRRRPLCRWSSWTASRKKRRRCWDRAAATR